MAVLLWLRSLVQEPKVRGSYPIEYTNILQSISRVRIPKSTILTVHFQRPNPTEYNSYSPFPGVEPRTSSQVSALFCNVFHLLEEDIEATRFSVFLRHSMHFRIFFMVSDHYDYVLHPQTDLRRVESWSVCF